MSLGIHFQIVWCQNLQELKQNSELNILIIVAETLHLAASTKRKRVNA
jgi:hypothetical protein